MLQLSATEALQCELVSPEETQDKKQYLPSSNHPTAAIRLQPLTVVSCEEIQDAKTQDTGPRLV